MVSLVELPVICKHSTGSSFELGAFFKIFEWFREQYLSGLTNEKDSSANAQLHWLQFAKIFNLTYLTVHYVFQ